MTTRLGSFRTVVRRYPIRSLATVLGLLVLGFGAYPAALHFYSAYHWREAEQAAARYDFEASERHLAACLWAYPRKAAFHFQMARAARRANHYDRAEEHLRACRMLQGRTPENALEALLINAQTGSIKEVEKPLLEQVELSSPNTSLILEALAQGYARIYHLDAARGCLNRLLEREPDHVPARLLRASLWRTAGNHAGELEDCRRAVEVQPQHRMARLRFAEALLANKQPDESLQQFEYLRQLPGGDDTEVLVGLARSHRRLAHTETARQILDDVLAREPHHGLALLERAKIALDSESPAAAEKWLRQAVADYPFDAQANYLLAQALRKQGRDEEARAYEDARTRIESDRKALDAAFRRVLKAPANPEPRLEAGLICQRNGRDDECERWLLSALEQSPEHAATRAALAEHYQRTGRTDLAELYRHPFTAGQPQLGRSRSGDSAP